MEVVGSRDCFICTGLMRKVPKMAESAVRKASHYQFRTFAVGVSLPEGIQDREDELRSDLRLRGNETIKTQTSRLVAARIASELDRRVDRLKPDLTLLIGLGTGEIAVSSRPVFLYGRYTKPPGITQRRELCPECRGKGCRKCRRSGFVRAPSVEEVLRKKLSSFMGSDVMTFTWLGSEDRSSIVFPPGRPFIAEVKCPVKRVSPHAFAAICGGRRVVVSGCRMLKSKPTNLPSFRFKTKIFATAASKVHDKDMARLRETFRRREVRFDRPYDRPASKMVYSVDATVRGRVLAIRAELDGGLPVKRFVSGELVSPSVSEVLKTEVRCRRFDICRVTETRRFEIG